MPRLRRPAPSAAPRPAPFHPVPLAFLPSPSLLLSPPHPSPSHPGPCPRCPPALLPRCPARRCARARDGVCARASHAESAERAPSAPRPLGLVAHRVAQQSSLPRELPQAAELLEESGAQEELDRVLDRVRLPAHPELRVRHIQANGFSFVVLPSASPAGRFEAHLEVCAGSADERDDQQGLAHLVEHVAYMGSRHRNVLLNTGAQTNAYTDFHHTVFHASCPTERRNVGEVVQLALNALREVLDETRFDKNRLEKERAAVLSEMKMVNTIEYRTEVQLLSFLHPENRLSNRFPIGLEQHIRRWSVDDAREFHETHYRTDNAILYLVGDFDDLDHVEKRVLDTFGSVRSRPQPFPDADVTLKQRQSRFFPPVTHRWASEGTVNGDVKPKLFRHDLLQGFSLHIFAKLPITPVKTLLDYKRFVIKSIVTMALQVRFNVQARGEANNGAVFNSVEAISLNSPREGCEVVSVDMMADREQWKVATRAAIIEMRRLASFGLTRSEVDRYVASLWANSEQLCAQADRLSNLQQVETLMEALASDDAYLSPLQFHEALGLILPTISMEEINEMAAELTQHIKFLSSSAIVGACVPTYGGFQISEEELSETIAVAQGEQIAATEEVLVPTALMSEASISELGRLSRSNLEFRPDGGAPSKQVKVGMLGNGIAVNLFECASEAGRVHLRLAAPGGRMVEATFGDGSVAIGARTMQEGGAFAPFTRQQVELFCVDNLIQVDISANTEFFFIDLSFPVAKLEFVMQLLHRILVGDFVWEEDAFVRAKQSFVQTQGEIRRSLEDAAVDEVVRRLLGNDSRFISISEDQMDSLSLELCKRAVMEHLTTDAIEISMIGDVRCDDVESLVTAYLGSVPTSARSETMASSVSARSVPEIKDLPDGEKDFVFELDDTDDRAAGFLAGSCPSSYGFRRDGTHISMTEEEIRDVDVRTGLSAKESRRRHPLFAAAAMDLLQQVINRRLFSALRERERLTYDAKFNFGGHERLLGSWYIAEVTASPDKVSKALSVMQETLSSMKSRTHTISQENLDSARRTYLVRLQSDSEHNDFVAEMVFGMQLPDVPLKCAGSLSERLRVIASITPDDLHFVLEHMDFGLEQQSTVIRCQAQTRVALGSRDESDVVVSPSAFRRGTALSH